MYLQRKQNRLKGYDYSKDGFYFITTVIQNRYQYFGRIQDGKMLLSLAGRIVYKQWLWLADQYPYVKLYEFVVMPEHFHGIIQINSQVVMKRKIKSVSELMGAFKTTSSKQIHMAGYPDFSWQRSFHDSILFDTSRLPIVEKYIRSNPENY